MSSKLDFILTEARRLLPAAINIAGSFYQEHLRKTEFSAMVPAMIGQGAYELTWNINSCASAHNRIIFGFGLAWAACAYKGLEKWSWTKDWACLAFKPAAFAIIDYVTPQGASDHTSKNSYVTHTNQKRVRFVLQTVALMVQTCALYKLQSNRNGSLSLKPYLYYGATLALLNVLSNSYIVPRLKDGLKAQGWDLRETSGFMISGALIILQLFLRIYVASVVAKLATGETVEVSKKWRLLTFAGQVLAYRYISP